MTRYLLAAEADKIQDLLFRSAKLREVSGGSQLLRRFCREVPSALGVSNQDTIISAGGGFRILFNTEEEATEFGKALAETYRRVTGGSLTVAKPVKVPEPVETHFRQASQDAYENLRRAKRHRDGWQVSEQIPYVAFCASCGVGLAATYRALHSGEDAQYICQSCLNKGEKRRSRSSDKSSAPERMGEFLADFYKVVADHTGKSLEDLHWPGEKKNKRIGEIDPLEDIAEYDPRRYVAYIVADGNNMGRVFSACTTPDKMRQLSEGLDRTVHEALAKPTKLLMKQERPAHLPENFVPVYPLILGGDDIFVLLPSPWALDFARYFAKEYESGMEKLVQRIGLKVPSPTISVAVVICKSKHPYTLAHEAGERRLSEAKQMGKRLQLVGKPPASTITFEVVLGGRLVEPQQSKSVRPTMRPYWALDENPEPKWGMPIKTLLEQRFALTTAGVSRKRLAELKQLYDVEQLPDRVSGEPLKAWRKRLKRLLERIRKDNEHFDAIDTALQSLGNGNKEKSYWRRISRYGEDTWYGHALPDLLEAWDFALKVDIPRERYEEAQA